MPSHASRIRTPDEHDPHAFRRAPPRQTRPRRPRFRTTTTTGSGRLPSACPPLCSGGGHRELALTLAPPAPHPFVCRDPSPLRQYASWSLQTAPCRRLSSQRAENNGKDASPRCLQPIFDTSTLRVVRLSSGLRNRSSGASFDDDPPASARSPTVITRRLRGERWRGCPGAARSWWMLRSAAPPAAPPAGGLFGLRARLRCDL